MSQEQKPFINLGKPLVLLNGLVTDKNNYTDEQKINMLKLKKEFKNKMPKNPKITYHSSLIEQNNNINNNKNNIMPLSEEEDHNNEVNVVSHLDKLNSEMNGENIMEENDNENIIQAKIDNDNNKDIEMKSNINLSNKNNKSRTKKNEKKTENKRGRPKKNKNENINITKFNPENNTEEKSNSKIKLDLDLKVPKISKKRFISLKKEEDVITNIEYKNVPKVDTYDSIIKECKNNSCAYISLIEQDNLKNLKLEKESQAFTLIKKMKKEKKVNIIISNKTNEINLTKNILYLLKSTKNNNNNFSIFKKLNPEHNNILQYMPISYTGINNYGYMFINHSNNNNSNSNSNNKNENEIHFITNFYNDKNSQYILLFRKYIFNISCFRTNNELNQSENDYNIYHIIIPKNSVNKININLNEETSLKSLIKKLNCEYYFYCQRPGELLIVEPESILLSYYYKENTGKDNNSEKNYLLMFWNKMNIESFPDYLILKNIFKNEHYRNIPIVNTLLNLVNQNSNILSDDIIKIILEIYNELDTYENINSYINEITNNNIRFHKLYLNDIYLCEHCGQEIFNFYVYDTYNIYSISNTNNRCDKNLLVENNNSSCDNYLMNKTGKFICVKCAKNKNYFNENKNIVFFKYTKDEVNNLILKINSKINKARNKDKNEIISDKFYGKRKNDCINMDEFLLKIDGPLRILDNAFQQNKNDIQVDKYLKLLTDNKNNIKDKEDLEPLNPNNFRNDITKNDLYEKLGTKLDYSIDIDSYNSYNIYNTYELNEPDVINDNSTQNNKNNSEINYINFKNENDSAFNNNEIRMSSMDMEIEKEKEKEKEVKNNSNSIMGSKKNKKKNCTNLQDIIFSGEF